MGARTDPQKGVVKQLKMPGTIAVTNGDFVRHNSRGQEIWTTRTREKLCHIRLDHRVRSTGYGSSRTHRPDVWLYVSILRDPWVCIEFLAHEVGIEL